jgi:molybdate transport system ATP-binding protein
MSMLEFDGRLSYGDLVAVRGGFRSEGRVTALIGPSGAGKSSILAMIAGLRRPDSGRIVLGDRVLFDSAAGICLKPEQRRAGCVFQDGLLFPHLSVDRNLRYGLRRRARRDGPITHDRVVDVLELRTLLGRWPRTLSGGEAQRVALGRALLSDPDLLLLDEPWSALDDALKQRILEYLERIAAEFRTPMLLVSHDLPSVQRLADWIVMIERGEITGSGPAAEILGG